MIVFIDVVMGKGLGGALAAARWPVGLPAAGAALAHRY